MIAMLFVVFALALQASTQDHPGKYSAMDIEAGSRLYAGQCALCHGPNGDLIATVDLRRGRFKKAVTDVAGALLGTDGWVAITPLASVLCAENQVRPRLVTKNTAARIAVVRLKKLAEPVAPKRLPEAPLPKAAPISAPLPCRSSTSPMMASAHNT